MEFSTKDYIEKILIGEVGQMTTQFPYLSFLVIGCGIEFLGKCINGTTTWQSETMSPGDTFNYAIENLEAFKSYRPFLTSHKLYGSWRCGLAHGMQPKQKISFSSKDEAEHFARVGDVLNLKIENVYEDFVNACREVIGRTYASDDKWHQTFLYVPTPPSTLKIPTRGGRSPGASSGLPPAASAWMPPDVPLI